MKRLVVAACFAMLPGIASASEVGTTLPSAAGSNAITLRTGFDDALVVTGLGYTRGIALRRARRSLMIGGELAMPMTRPGWDDFRITTGVRINAVQTHGFELPFAGGLRVIRTRNRLFDGVGVGTYLASYPGYYRPRWFVAAELRWDHTWATHLHHSKTYRERIYPGVVDGWYGATAWSMRYGFRAGGLPHPRVELMLRVGYEHLPGLRPVIPALYADLTLGVRFGAKLPTRRTALRGGG
jgi:hypothetical protein